MGINWKTGQIKGNDYELGASTAKYDEEEYKWNIGISKSAGESERGVENARKD